MKLPNLLIIGAMKAGTTSLYVDLTSHPQAFRGESKEPHALCDEHVLTDAGREQYAALYASAGSSELIIDASTHYSKRPDFENVAQRAVEVLPEGFKVVYMIRHPIKRIISQHHHEFTAGLVGPCIDDEVRKHSRFVDYSRYAYQLQPWLDAIGADRIRLVKFEDYTTSRAEIVRDLVQFMGVSEFTLPRLESKAYNKTDGKPVRSRFWDYVFHSSVYRRALRNALPPTLRLSLMQWLLPKGSLRPADPNPETIMWLRGKLAGDVAALQQFLGTDVPLWDDFGPAAKCLTADSVGASNT